MKYNSAFSARSKQRISQSAAIYGGYLKLSVLLNDFSWKGAKGTDTFFYQDGIFYI